MPLNGMVCKSSARVIPEEIQRQWRGLLRDIRKTVKHKIIILVLNIQSWHFEEKKSNVLPLLKFFLLGLGLEFLVFNATFNSISVISWRSVLLVEKTEVRRENH